MRDVSCGGSVDVVEVDIVVAGEVAAPDDVVAVNLWILICSSVVGDLG